MRPLPTCPVFGPVCLLQWTVVLMIACPIALYSVDEFRVQVVVLWAAVSDRGSAGGLGYPQPICHASD